MPVIFTHKSFGKPLRRVGSVSSVYDHLFSHQNEQHYPYIPEFLCLQLENEPLLTVVMTGVRLTLLGV